MKKRIKDYQSSLLKALSHALAVQYFKAGARITLIVLTRTDNTPASVRRHHLRRAFRTNEARKSGVCK